MAIYTLHVESSGIIYVPWCALLSRFREHAWNFFPLMVYIYFVLYSDVMIRQILWKKNNVNYTVGILKLGDLLLLCTSDNAIAFSLLGHEYKRRTCEPRLINNSWHAGVVSKDKAELQFFHQTVLIYNNLRKAFIFYTIMRYGCCVKKGNVTSS